MTRFLSGAAVLVCACGWVILSANDAMLGGGASQVTQVTIVGGAKYAWTSEGINRALRDACDGEHPRSA
jgi:hypothetical protein